VETVYSLAHERPDGAAVVFDFVIDPSAVGWYRHAFTPAGSYVSLDRAGVDDIRGELGSGAPASLVIELRSAATALEASAGSLRQEALAALDAGADDEAETLLARADEIDLERGRALVEVMSACDAAWDDALERVERAQGNDADGLPAAMRNVEMLWTARQAVRRMLRSLRPA